MDDKNVPLLKHPWKKDLTDRLWKAHLEGRDLAGFLADCVAVHGFDVSEDIAEFEARGFDVSTVIAKIEAKGIDASTVIAKIRKDTDKIHLQEA